MAYRSTTDWARVRPAVFARDGYTCQADGCGRMIAEGQPQVAHIMPAWDELYETYGEEIVDHPENLSTACSLECNKRLELKSKAPIAIEAQVARIRAAIELERDHLQNAAGFYED